MSKMPYVKVFSDMQSTVSLLSDSEAGRLLKALLAYINGEEVEVSGQERLVYSMLRTQIDRDTASYQAFADKQRENGKKGGRPKNPEKPMGFLENPKKPSLFLKTQKSQEEEEKEEDKEKDKDEEEDKTKTKKKTVGASPRFTPPTVDEVRDYCDERHNNVNAERFVDFYESKGWRVGSQPMKDWRAAVRTWENRDDRPGQAEKPKKSSNPFFDMLKAEQAKRAVEVEPEIERW